MWAWAWAAVYAVGAIAAAYMLEQIVRFPRRADVRGKHVFITGGSKGIGRAMAVEFFKRGASVTISARNEHALREAMAAIHRAAAGKIVGNQSLHIEKADVANARDIERAVRSAEATVGRPVDVLVSNAGLSVPGYFAEQDIEVFANTMTTNYLGAVHAIKAVVNDMMARRAGHVVIVSSPLGLAGTIGFGSYTPTKFALRGLAEVLYNELRGFGIDVTVVYPVDTDTEGFQREMETKPEEAKVISGAAGVMSPEQVAKIAVDGIIARRVQVDANSIGWLMNLLATSGLFLPHDSWVLAILVRPILTPITWILNWHHNRIGATYGKRAHAAQRSKAKHS